MTPDPVTPDPADPLGVDELVEARQRWDAEIAAILARWDAIAPPADPPQDQPASAADLDLTRFDHLADQTDKLTVFDDLLPQPLQGPRWRPPGSV